MKTKKLLLMIPFLFVIMGSCINEPFYTTATFPSVSVDGKQIAFFYTYGNHRGEGPFEQGIYIMSFDGSDKKQIYPQDYSSVYGWISWNPSGRQLFTPNGVITLQNNEFKEIRSNKILDAIENRWHYTWNFTWSPDGNNILYNIEDSIYICDTLFQYSRKMPFKGKGARWMPDGERLSYMRDREFYITDTLTCQEIQITNDGLQKGAAIPSPDGTTLSYMTSYGNLWLINTDGSNPRFLKIINAGGGYSWTSDSKSIVYSRSLDGWSTFLWKIDIDGKNDMQISK